MITRKDLISSIVERGGVYKYQATAMVDILFDEMKNALANGEKVSIRNFGTFEPKVFKSHAAVHPSTKKPIVVPEFKRVAFRPGTELINAVRNEE